MVSLTQGMNWTMFISIINITVMIKPLTISIPEPCLQDTIGAAASIRLTGPPVEVRGRLMAVLPHPGSLMREVREADPVDHILIDELVLCFLGEELSQVSATVPAVLSRWVGGR